MKVVSDIAKMRELSFQTRAAGLKLALVPTMGALHGGHLALVRRARSLADVVVVSIFVNPTQFNDSGDFAAYPSDLDGDRTLLAAERVDILFAPSVEEVYPQPALTAVRVGELGDHLCGPTRPGHFEGVATVVAALLHMVGPDVAVFGEKDYQQLQIIRRMVSDLHFPTRIASTPTVRESDGLAMSSRNRRLSPAQRETAPAIFASLSAAAQAFVAGEKDAEAIKAVALHRLAEYPQLQVEYLELVEGASLQPVARADGACVLATAVKLGDVRLIDNVVFANALCEQDTLSFAPIGVNHHA